MGYLPHSSLVTEDGIAGVFSVDDLIKRSITTVDITSAKNCFSLHSALQVKAGIMSAAYENFGDLANTLQGEIVTYAVLNRPFT